MYSPVYGAVSSSPKSLGHCDRAYAWQPEQRGGGYQRIIIFSHHVGIIEDPTEEDCVLTSAGRPKRESQACRKEQYDLIGCLENERRAVVMVQCFFIELHYGLRMLQPNFGKMAHPLGGQPAVSCLHASCDSSYLEW
jgi:hypothetical protein